MAFTGVELIIEGGKRLQRREKGFIMNSFWRDVLVPPSEAKALFNGISVQN
jgi:hypothetical protein